MNDVLKAHTILSDAGYIIEKSNIKDFDWHIISPDEDDGVHLTNKQFIELANEVQQENIDNERLI